MAFRIGEISVVLIFSPGLKGVNSYSTKSRSPPRICNVTMLVSYYGTDKYIEFFLRTRGSIASYGLFQKNNYVSNKYRDELRDMISKHFTRNKNNSPNTCRMDLLFEKSERVKTHKLSPHNQKGFLSTHSSPGIKFRVVCFRYNQNSILIQSFDNFICNNSDSFFVCSNKYTDECVFRSRISTCIFPVSISLIHGIAINVLHANHMDFLYCILC